MHEVNRIAIDRSGRIRIPKTIRTRLGLSPGTRLVIETHDDEEIRLRPVREQPKLVDKGGVLVVQSSAVEELDGVEKRVRQERLDELVQQTEL